MIKVSLHKAKTNFSKLVGLASQGQEVIICKAGKPVAKLVSFCSKKEKRKSGIWAGKVIIEKDFDILPAKFLL